MKDLLKLDICQTLDAGGEKAELKTKKWENHGTNDKKEKSIV